MKHKQFTRDDIEDIKRYAQGGMSNVDIAYVMECHESSISRVLSQERQRYKTERGIKRKLFGGNGLVGTGCSKVKCFTDDTEKVHYEQEELPEDYDPTLEMATLLERMEHEEN